MRRAGPLWADSPAAGSRLAAPLGRLARVTLGVAAVAVAGLAVASTLSSLAAQRTAAQGPGHGEGPAHPQTEGQGASAWEEVREARPRFVLEGPEFGRAPDVYSVRRNVAGGGRLDQMAFGVPHEPGPYLRLTFYRPFDEPVAGRVLLAGNGPPGRRGGAGAGALLAGARTRAHAPGRFRGRRPARRRRARAAPLPWISPSGHRTRFHDLGDSLSRRGVRGGAPGARLHSRSDQARRRAGRSRTCGVLRAGRTGNLRAPCGRSGPPRPARTQMTPRLRNATEGEPRQESEC